MTPLDKALIAAKKNENERVPYYNLFLNSTIYIPTHDVPETEYEGRAPAQQQINPIFVESDGMKYLMLFDTLERLNTWAQKQVGYVAILGYTIVEMMMGTDFHWVLNADTKNTKVFNLEEIQWIRESFLASVSHHVVVPQDTQAMVRAPQSIPEGLLETLQQNFSTHNLEIQEAYLAELFYTSEAEIPHLTLILQVNTADKTVLDAIQKDIFMAINKIFTKQESFDIMCNNNDFLTAIMRLVPPFYARKK